MQYCSLKNIAITEEQMLELPLVINTPDNAVKCETGWFISPDVVKCKTDKSYYIKVIKQYKCHLKCRNIY